MSKKKSTENNGINIEDFELFKKSGRKKAFDDSAPPAKRKNHIRTALIIFIAAVILLVGVPWLAVTVISSPNKAIINDGLSKHTYEELLEHTSATEKSSELFSMRNPDITDREAVTALIDYLQPENELGDYSVEIQSSERPYTLTLKFRLSHEASSEAEERWEISVIKYSCAIMSLMSNVAQVNWEFPTDSGEISGSYFTRADAEKLMNLNVPVTRFAESETSVQLLLNQLGIDLY